MADSQEVRELATAIQQQSDKNSSDYGGIRKGVVTSIDQSNPPTLTVTLSGDSTPISGVKYTRSFFPQVNDVVLMHKQGNELIAFDAVTTTYKNDYTRTASDAGDGLQWATNQFSVKANSTSGIAVDGNGVRVNPGSGIIVDSGGTRVRAGAGIAVDGTGVRVSPGNAINVSGGTVNVTKAAACRHAGVDYGGATDTTNFKDTGNGTLNNNFYVCALYLNSIENVLRNAGLMT